MNVGIKNSPAPGRYGSKEKKMTATQVAKELFKNMGKYESVVIDTGYCKIDVYEIGVSGGYYHMNPKEDDWSLNQDNIQRHYVFEKTEYGYIGRHKSLKGIKHIVIK